jgi:hypothetical protein
MAARRRQQSQCSAGAMECLFDIWPEPGVIYLNVNNGSSGVAPFSPAVTDSQAEEAPCDPSLEPILMNVNQTTLPFIPEKL